MKWTGWERICYIACTAFRKWQQFFNIWKFNVGHSGKKLIAWTVGKQTHFEIGVSDPLLIWAGTLAVKWTKNNWYFP